MNASDALVPLQSTLRPLFRLLAIWCNLLSSFLCIYLRSHDVRLLSCQLMLYRFLCWLCFRLERRSIYWRHRTAYKWRDVGCYGLSLRCSHQKARTHYGHIRLLLAKSLDKFLSSECAEFWRNWWRIFFLLSRIVQTLRGLQYHRRLRDLSPHSNCSNIDFRQTWCLRRLVVWPQRLSMHLGSTNMRFC